MRGIIYVALLMLMNACAIPAARQDPHSGLFQRFSNFETGQSGRHRARQKEWSTTEVRKIFADGPGAWEWPVEKVKITGEFGRRGRRFHDGVDLRAPYGTPVFAASPGVVIHSGQKISGYGNMVVIQHRGGFYSIYAHNSKNLVRVGDEVHAGDEIALAGSSGRADGPHLHFEIRKNSGPVDPLKFLPDL